MKIFDLTRGKYPEMYSSANDSFYADKENDMSNLSFMFNSLFANGRNDIAALLNNIPVFLVETSMSRESIAVPGCQCSVIIPADKYVSSEDDDDFDIESWLGTKEREKDDPRERTSSQTFISDLLGVYIYTNEHDIIPRRIFIWMDKIKDYAEKETRNRTGIRDNARALFDLVLFHEMSHALMDVELYGQHPAPDFSYVKDKPFRFIEEAYANGIALSILMEKISNGNFAFNAQQQKFLEDFVKNQGGGYSYGWNLYNMHSVHHLEQWLGIKVIFDIEVAYLLKESWLKGDFPCFSFEEFFKSVGRNGWIAVKDRFHKYGIMELPSQKMVAGFKKYDSFWSFDDNGLCMVRLDQKHDYLYGYVNEQGVEQIPVQYDHVYSFENGITIAKSKGRYGAIDCDNKIVIPFNLPYDDVRGFRDGRAAVKNSAGKWGVIDTTGKEIVPCTNNNIVI